MSLVHAISTARRKPYMGVQMEGPVASWYARMTRDRRDHRANADTVARQLPAGGAVLEVAPGPGYLAIDLARRYPGVYRITGLDISHSLDRIARDNTRDARVAIDFQQGGVDERRVEAESVDFAVY